MDITEILFTFAQPHICPNMPTFAAHLKNKISDILHIKKWCTFSMVTVSKGDKWEN